MTPQLVGLGVHTIGAAAIGKDMNDRDESNNTGWAYFINDEVWRGCWIANKSGDVTPFKIAGLVEGA